MCTGFKDQAWVPHIFRLRASNNTKYERSPNIAFFEKNRKNG